MAFRLHSELSEKQIEADVATYFGWITPNGSVPFRLLDIDEQLTGADKLFDSVIPIYMQFKVSHGLKQLTTRGLNISPLQRIRNYRRNEALFDNPTLYFKLREKAATADDFQHNILGKLSNGYNSHAFYVAPLTLNLKDYEKALFDSTDRYLNFPFHFIRSEEIHQERWTSYFGHIPFLRAHISILPHEPVTTANHYYSFSTTGTEIAWHSPKLMSKGAYRLSDTLKRIFSQAFANPEYWDFIEDRVSLCKKMAEEFKINWPSNRNQDQKPIETLIDFGHALYEQYSIRQILLVTKKESLLKYKSG